MKEGFRPAMAWLHTWGGLVFTWLLFAIFFAGTLSFYREEITLWMQPELHRVQSSVDQFDGVAFALKELQQRAPDAKRWSINFPDARDATISISWTKDGRFDRNATAVIDPNNGAVLNPRATLGGTFFRSFHYSLMAGPLGVWIVGAATMMMLVALITGVIIHKKIFKDFFTFRPQKSPGRSWLDAHNVSGVMSLPFHLMITYTGLVTLMFTFVPAAATIAYQGDQALFLKEAFSRKEAPAASGQPAALTDLLPLLIKTRTHWHGAEIGGVTINNPGDTVAVIDITRKRGATLAARAEPVLRFDGVSGQQLNEFTNDSVAKSTYGVFYGLHVAWYAGFFLRALSFVMGITGCVMIASGAVLWTVKRRDKHTGDSSATGYRFVEAFNVAGIAGLMVASAIYFWANRLLPVNLQERIDWEMRCLFIAWLLTLAHAILRDKPTAAWRDQFWLAGFLIALLPVLNAVTGGLSLFEAMLQNHWRLAGVDLSTMPLAAVLAWTGWRIGLPKKTTSAKRNSKSRIVDLEELEEAA
ncbi:MAG: PepSY protein [Verrucomicrobiaceae bacterium]|nr:PepSY protein [Verrucomicrobiaceae bacterium]